MTTAEQSLTDMQEWDKDRKRGDIDPRDPREQAQRLAAAFHAKKTERRGYLTSKPTRDVVFRNIDTLVDARHAELVAECGAGILDSFAGATELKSDGRLRTRPPRIYRPSARLDVVDVLILLSPDVVKANCRAAVPEYKAGPPLAERGGLIAACDRELAALSDAHTRLVEAAAQLTPPVRLELLQEVQEQQQEDRLQLDRDRAAAQARERAEAAIEESRRQRRMEPRVGRSEYLETGRR